MTCAKPTNLGEIEHALEGQLHQELIVELTKSQDGYHLKQIAAEVATNFYLGRVAYIGQTANGSYGVQFNVRPL